MDIFSECETQHSFVFFCAIVKMFPVEITVDKHLYSYTERKDLCFHLNLLFSFIPRKSFYSTKKNSFFFDKLSNFRTNLYLFRFHFQNEFNTTMVHGASCGWNQYASDISGRISTEIVSIRHQLHLLQVFLKNRGSWKKKSPSVVKLR